MLSNSYEIHIAWICIFVCKCLLKIFLRVSAAALYVADLTLPNYWAIFIKIFATSLFFGFLHFA